MSFTTSLTCIRTDVIEILKGNLVPLKHGYIAVVNRSQQEIIRDKSIEQALRSEKAFFESHTIYSLMEHKCGTPSLVKTLNTVLNYIINPFIS